MKLDFNPHARFALDHPVYDPTADILPGHTRLVAPAVSACLTVNIGQE